MATRVIKESNVRDIFKDRQVTAEAIQCIDSWVEKNLLAISQGLIENARITDVDIDLYITTKLLNDSTWITARDIFLTKMIEYKSAEEK
jgi:serine protease inhibitor